MISPHDPTRSSFDQFADDYESALNRGLCLSGEDRNYFARGRVAWIERRLDQIGFVAENVLDYGCGTGTAVPYLRRLRGATSVCGVDVSPASIDVARKSHAGNGVSFVLASDFVSMGRVDLVYANGVFHHIPPKERLAALKLIKDSMRPGGILALWENNAWNPATRMVMRRIPFDRDAEPIAPPACRRMVTTAGFDHVVTDFLFIFPRLLRVFRFLEPWLTALPLGTQYLILARKS